MTICKVNICPYNQGGKFCKKEFTSINQNGCCNILWYKDRQKQQIFDNELGKIKQINVVDVDFQEWDQQKEEQRERQLANFLNSKKVNGIVRKHRKRLSKPRFAENKEKITKILKDVLKWQINMKQN